jgi:hypothetical protein
MSNDIYILRRLAKIATNKQIILEKLAQAKEEQQKTIDYINNGLIAVVAANLGLQHVSSKVTYQPAPDPMVITTPDEPGTFSSTKQSDKYFADIFGIPANKRESFAKAVGLQLQSQKPELLGRFSYWFKE